MAKRKSARKVAASPIRLSKVPIHLGGGSNHKDGIHISDITPYKSTSGDPTIKEFSNTYGWSGRADFVLEKLKSLGFNVLTQLDHVKPEAKKSFAESFGYSLAEFEALKKKLHHKNDQRLTFTLAAYQSGLTPSELFTKLMFENATDKIKALSEPISVLVCF